MRKSLMLIAAMCMTSVMTFAQKTVRVSTDKTDLVMKVSPKGRLYQVYLGDKMLSMLISKYFDHYFHFKL